MNFYILKEGITMGWTEYGEWQTGEGVRLLQDCGICTGMNVLDFGCSIGEYSIPASVAVGDSGLVVSADKNIHCVKTLRETCDRFNISNITTIKCSETSDALHNIFYDCVMYFDLYHQMGKEPQKRSEENQRILRLITNTLKSQGILLVSVFSEMCLIWDEKNGKRTPKGFLKADKVSIEEGIRWFRMIETIEECGFKLQRKISKAVHFDEFYKKGEPDMNEFERGDIFVFEKTPIFERTE